MVLWKSISSVRKAVVLVVAFGAVVLGAESAAQAQCPGPPTQCRNCLLAGQPILFFPGDPGPETRTLQNVLYQETGPFLSTPSAPANISAVMSLSPAAPSAAQLLGAAILETMGYCEGPITFSQIGDGGQTTTNLGPCGTLSDTFSVVSDGSGSAPYEIKHTLSGNLTLQNLPSLGPEIDRLGDITIGSQSATGEIELSTGGTPLCSGTFSASYTTHPTVTLPWPCTIRSAWTSYAPANNTATGTVVRQQSTFGPFTVTPNSGPAAGGTAVTICGPGACTASSVTFGGLAANNLACGGVATCPGPDFPLLATTPAHAAGVVNVVLGNGTATSTLTNGYTYTGAAAPALPPVAASALAALLLLLGAWAVRRSAGAARAR